MWHFYFNAVKFWMAHIISRIAGPLFLERLFSLRFSWLFLWLFVADLGLLSWIFIEEQLQLLRFVLHSVLAKHFCLFIFLTFLPFSAACLWMKHWFQVKMKCAPKSLVLVLDLIIHKTQYRFSHRKRNESWSAIHLFIYPLGQNGISIKFSRRYRLILNQLFLSNIELVK